MDKLSRSIQVKTLKADQALRTESVRFLIMPSNPIYSIWDLFLTAVLIFSCIESPVQLALFHECEEEGGGHRLLNARYLSGTDAACLNSIWDTINYIMDFLFLIDIILQFNVA
jgi:hypothetical protein